MNTASTLQQVPATFAASKIIGKHRFGPGLVLRVAAVGSSWIFRYTSPVTGKRREIGLGPLAAMNDEQFAAELARHRSDVHKFHMEIRQGRCPLAEKQAADASRKVESIRSRGLTVRRMLRKWCDANESRWSTKYASSVARMIENDPPGWLLDIPAIDLTAEHVIDALREMERNIPARRIDLARQRLSWALEWMIDGGHLSANAAGVLRIVRGRFAEVDA